MQDPIQLKEQLNAALVPNTDKEVTPPEISLLHIRQMLPAGAILTLGRNEYGTPIFQIDLKNELEDPERILSPEEYIQIMADVDALIDTHIHRWKYDQENNCLYCSLINKPYNFVGMTKSDVVYFNSLAEPGKSVFAAKYKQLRRSKP